MKRWLLLVLIVFVLVVVIGGVYAVHVYNIIQGFKAQGQPKSTVSTVKVASQDWHDSLAAIGSLRAERGANLSSEVLGVVDEIHFKSGDTVKRGDLLVHLRDGDELGQLHVLQANAELAKTTLKRDREQLEAKAIAQATVDSDEANLKSDLAQIEQQQAIINKKNIHAPFDGELGIRQVDLGQFINPGDKIVTLQTLDPIFVDFNLPQQALAEIAAGQSVKATADTYPDLAFDGEISVIEPIVDTGTRNVQVRATLKNPDHKLLPGMFANVSIELGQTQKYLTLPQTAVTFNPYGETVYVVATADALKGEQDAQAKADAASKGQSKAAKPDDKKEADKAASAAAADQPPQDGKQLVAKQVFVTVGPTRGDQVAILKGLHEGDEVVTSGQLKLKNGAAVVINNSVIPTDNPNPKPVDE